MHDEARAFKPSGIANRIGKDSPVSLSHEIKNTLTLTGAHGRIIVCYLRAGPIISTSFLEEKFDSSEAILNDDDGLHYWR